MGASFNDITLYAPTSYKTGTQEYWEERALYNYISELYKVCMHGYKPPNATKISIDPSHYKIWDKPWKHGAVQFIAVEFNYEFFCSLQTQEKHKYVLNVIQEAMIILSEEYNWDKTVFEKAYNEIIENDFKFKIEYPGKISRDKKKVANIRLEKTTTVTTVNAYFIVDGQHYSVKLFDKKNWWIFDSVYFLVKNIKWFDNDRFGLMYKPSNWSCWYSVKDNQVYFELNGIITKESNLEKTFKF